LSFQKTWGCLTFFFVYIKTLSLNIVFMRLRLKSRKVHRNIPNLEPSW